MKTHSLVDCLHLLSLLSASGPSNSMRGASYLAGFDLRKDGGKSTVVLDIGGTSSDVGVLLPSGFPRQASAFTEVGGVRTK